MPRPALYSRSPRNLPPQDDDGLSDAVPAPVSDAVQTGRWARLQSHLSPHNVYLLWGFVGLLALMLAFSLLQTSQTRTQRLTQDDINAAVLKTLETTPLPSPAAKAYVKIAPSVVRVVALQTSKDAKGMGKDTDERSVGTGVVVVDKGVILTSLHVVAGAESITVTFSDGLQSTAIVTSTQPENDLAVLQAATIPDDLIAATLRSTADLRPGDEVMAVGYPFGIGPSASSGIVSGLKRTFRSPEGKKEMTNLIQFDAAANPGNSGGPLATMDGEVIGIVTAIFNPNQQRSFVGIGFAVPIENAASAAGMPPF